MMLVQVFRKTQNCIRSSLFHSFCFTKHKSKCKLRTKFARLTLGVFAHLLLALCSCSFEKKQPSRRLFCLPQSFYHSVVAFLSAKTAKPPFPMVKSVRRFSRPSHLNLAHLLGRLGCAFCHRFQKKLRQRLCSSLIVLLLKSCGAPVHGVVLLVTASPD